MVMFKIQKLLQPFISSGVLCIGQCARAEEDVSRFVTIIDGASNGIGRCYVGADPQLSAVRPLGNELCIANRHFRDSP
jgi:hypothetical protein